MKEIPPATPEFMAEKERQEEKRRAYLLRKLGADGVWKMQQEAVSQLAQLRPDLARRRSRKVNVPSK